MFRPRWVGKPIPGSWTLEGYRINGIEMINEDAVDEGIIEAGVEEEKEVEGGKGEEEADSRPR